MWKSFFSNEHSALKQHCHSRKSFKQHTLLHVILNNINIRHNIFQIYLLQRITIFKHCEVNVLMLVRTKTECFGSLCRQQKCYLCCRMSTSPLVTKTHTYTHIHTQECQRNYNAIQLCCKTHYHDSETSSRESERQRECVCVEGVPSCLFIQSKCVNKSKWGGSSRSNKSCKIGQCCFVVPLMILNPFSGTSSHF